MLDEALAVCKRLWMDEVVEHHGVHFDFPAVMFEPKPVQKPWPPVHVGGESGAALRRAARAGDGWVGMAHTLGSIGVPVARLREMRASYGRADARFEVTVGGPVETRDDVRRWEDAGVDRLIVSPGTDAAVIEATVRAGLVSSPGYFTPSEAFAALKAGAQALKLFPAEPAGGVRWLNAVIEPLPDIRFCPTGGVNGGNAASYLALRNVLAVGGSWVAPPAAIAAGDFAGITARARVAAALRH